MVEIKAPFIVSIQVTGQCNLKCKYCYASDLPSQHIPPDRLLDIIKELKTLGVFQILIDGGEPFLHPDIIDILKESLKYYPNLAVLSNGTLLDKNFGYQLKALMQENPNLEIQISLDSHIPEINDKVRGQGDIVINNIKRLLGLGIGPTIATVIHKHNIKVACEIVDHFYPHVKKFHFMNLMPTKSSIENRTLLFPTKDELKDFWEMFSAQNMPSDIAISRPYDNPNTEFGKSSIQCKGCLAGLAMIDITPRLDIVACPIAKNALMGNLNNMTFEEIWYSDKTDKIRKKPFPLCRGEI